MRQIFLISILFCGSDNVSTGFSPSLSSARRPVTETRQRPTTSTRLYGLFGRFRKKKTVEQVKPIVVGDLLPDGDVEVLKHGAEEGAVDYATESIRTLLGTGKTLLVGMPGAFTPTCTAQHLPGYVKNAGKLAEVGGINTIAVLTTNDRFVNEEWGAQQGALGSTSDLMMLSDGDGDFVKALGLADDMGFGVGVRSKRFALVLQDGKVEHLVVDEGLNDCSCTSAEAVLKLVASPAALQEEEGGMEVGVGAVAAVAAAVALFAATSMGGGAPSFSSPPPTAARVEKINPSPAQRQPPSQGFTLLEQFKP